MWFESYGQLKKGLPWNNVRYRDPLRGLILGRSKSSLISIQPKKPRNFLAFIHVIDKDRMVTHFIWSLRASSMVYCKLSDIQKEGIKNSSPYTEAFVYILYSYLFQVLQTPSKTNFRYKDKILKILS